ncbi:hypothetical protein PoHVEF18_005893 [Penicillium ochrochloron]
MALVQLPTELLELIIPLTLPEGFESLALTCKFLYSLCTPFLEHYNNLRWHFRDFRFVKTNKDFQHNRQLLKFPDTVTSAFNLISRIAIEPAVGRYILEADFAGDSRLYGRLSSITREQTTYEDRDEAVLPASLSVLSLFSPGKSPHEKALDFLFCDFATQKQLQTPNLKDIFLTCPDDADDSYKAQCTFSSTSGMLRLQVMNSRKQGGKSFEDVLEYGKQGNKDASGGVKEWAYRNGFEHDIQYDP